VKQLSLIIVTYNAESLIRDCLESISKFNDLGDELELIIVDNNSRDQEKLSQIIASFAGLNIVLLKAPGNNGYGTGNNIGVRHATAPYILIMNPDVRLIKPVFRDLLKEFGTTDNLGMAGVSFADHSSPLYLKPEYYTVLKILFIKLLQKYNLLPFNQTYMSGSFLVFDKAAFIQAGCFDEQIFLYLEEADITNRLISNGKKIKWVDTIKVFHLTEQRRFNEKLVSAEIDSLDYYCHKFQLNRKIILSRYLMVNRMKYFVALITRNQIKKEMFGGWVKILKRQLA
jgi:GT2 family glycosyltransferase